MILITKQPISCLSLLSPSIPISNHSHTMNIHDPFPIPSCFSSADKLADPASPFAATKPGQSVVTSVHRTKIAGHSRLITVTWCRNLFLHGLCVSVESAPSSPDETSANNAASCCKVELKPWCFWRKQGSRKFDVEGHLVQVFWDLRTAKFCGEPEPRSDYYVAVVSNSEVVLLLGDRKKEVVHKRTCCRPAAIDATLVSKNEHVFGKKRFATRARFNEKGRYHEICIECGSSGAGGKLDPQMVVKIDGQVVIHVKHLQWKFRGNETVSLSKERVEVYWDVHDWLFSPGLKHALFIFKPLPAVHSSLIPNPNSSNPSSQGGGNGPSCSFFLYAWKIE